MTSGTVFDIQRFSVHDGPGIRTTVFLKGCSLRCFWCHNPEGIHPQPEIQFEPEKCIGCGECVKLCEHGAQHLEDGQRTYDRDCCTVCGQCVETCFAGGLALIGKTMSVDEVMVDVLPDAAFYQSSGGGVTFSGGEPVLQTDFLHDLLVRCRSHGIHIAIETAGYYPWDRLERVLPHIDMVMMDIKHMDSAQHKAATGAPNDLILANARHLAATPVPVLFRVPVIPTVNDSPDAILAIAQFVRRLSEQRGARIPLELLQFHRLAENKYTSLGRSYQAHGLPDKVENFQELVSIVDELGV